MSMPEDRQAPHEIVIVRRRPGGHGDGHHGGAWKIAFADFMTALMCFFLVMWLINASDKKTIMQIATYFNPTRLNDRVTSQKGLHDVGESSPKNPDSKKLKQKSPLPNEAGAEGQNGTSVRNTEAPRSQAERAIADEIDLIRDPYGVLEKLVSSDSGLRKDESSKANIRPSLPKDLFDIKSSDASIARPDGPQSMLDSPSHSPLPQPAIKSSPVETPGVRTELSAEWLQAEIAQGLAALDMQFKPKVEVTDEGREVMVSITDDFEPGMFAIGSSLPTQVLVHVMGTVGGVLARKGGAVVVRGHTDARPFSAGPYDNWRLSSARAQVAYYMLTRGGLMPERVMRIEGHADRRLRVPSAPLASQNRRIEILVAKGDR